MSRWLGVSLLVVVVVAGAALGQVPRGYELSLIYDDDSFNYTAQMNNHGQIVFSVWDDGGNTDETEIYLYDNGDVIPLTSDHVYDRTPDINDAGQIVWARAVDGPGTPPQIVLWEDGVLTQLTDSVQENHGPRINNLGHVVWKRYMGDIGCEERMDIFWYDGNSVQRVTTNGESENLTNQGAVINDSDWIAWTEYDFCPSEWQSRIMLRVEGISMSVSAPETPQPQSPSINTPGDLAWTFQSGWGEKGIQLWSEGTVTTLTEWGGGPLLNDRGDIAFRRFYDNGPIGAYEVWLWNGRFWRITSDPHSQGWENVWNLPTDMNDKGEIAYTSGRPWYYESAVYCMSLSARALSDEACPAGGPAQRADGPEWP